MLVIANDFRVKPGERVSLKVHDAVNTGGMTKKQARKELAEVKSRLSELQQLLYATEKHSLLIVLQGMDTAGKDGVIKHVMSAFNPQGCQVTNFKKPTPEELDHDFLWRVHKATPRRGMAGIFNRSHYEDVLVVRVEELVPKSVWQRRYEAINQFEEILSEGGTVILKFFLNISQEEQRERLQERLQDPRDHWKFRVGDLRVRARWDEYMAAYEDALAKCSTERTPWYVIPSDKKWYRNLVVSQITSEALGALDMEWPKLETEAEGIEIV